MMENSNVFNAKITAGRPSKKDNSDLSKFCRWRGCNHEGESPRVFASMYEAREHEIAEHASSLATGYFSCEINDCTNSSQTLEQLVKHMKAVHGIRVHNCTYCNVRFSDLTKLTRHLNTSKCKRNDEMEDCDQHEKEKENKRLRNIPEDQYHCKPQLVEQPIAPIIEFEVMANLVAANEIVSAENKHDEDALIAELLQFDDDALLSSPLFEIATAASPSVGLEHFEWTNLLREFEIDDDLVML